MPTSNTKLTSNFTIIANDLITSNIPPSSKTVLIYLLSKPANWKLRREDLKKQLGLTYHAIKKALKWLQQAGYMYYKRYFGGQTQWFIFDKPQVARQTKTAASPDIPTPVEITHVLKQPVLIKTETETKKEITTTPIEENVVVDGLIYPSQLDQKQKQTAKHILKKLKQPEFSQEVLFALAYAMTNQKINSIPAYLHGLVNRANDGTFEPISENTVHKPSGKPLIPIWQGFGNTAPCDTELAKSSIQQLRFALKGALC